MTKLTLEIEPPHPQAGTREFDAFPVLLGRDPQAEVAFDSQGDLAVSWHHARIDSTPEGLTVADCDSTNGTWLNGKPVTHALLADGDLLQFGSEGPRLRLRFDSALQITGDVTSKIPVSAPEEPGLVISLLEGAPAWPAGARHFRQSVVTLGRETTNDVAFASPPHPVVSRYHAEIVLRGGEYQLRDKDATNGTFVNDRRIDTATLADGDRVMLGQGGPVVAVHLPGRKRTAQSRRHGLRTVLVLSVVFLLVAGGSYALRRFASPPPQVASFESESTFIESRVIEFARFMQDEVDHVPPSMIRQVQHFASELARLERESLERDLSRTRELLPEVERILRSHGLPECLAFIAFHESRFDPQAKSAAGAVGLWQLMPATAREYGLRVDRTTDERLDPLKSTHAAARYLKKLYLLYGDFMLTLAAYNYGPANVNQALTALLHDEPLKNRNYWYLVKLDLLPRETDEYVYKVIAGWIVATRPERFGLDAGSALRVAGAG